MNMDKNKDNDKYIDKDNIRDYGANEENADIKSKHIVFMFIWILITLIISFEIYNLVLYTFGKKEKDEMWLYNLVSYTFDCFASSKKEVKEEYTLKVACLGDIYFTSNTKKVTQGKNSYNFLTGTDEITNYLKNFDVVMASLVSSSDSPSLIELLKNLNISVVATASSHALDKNVDGVKKTINSLKSNNIDCTGTSNDKSKPVIVDKNNIKVGIISYTTYTNKLSKNNKDLLNVYDKESVKQDIEYLKDNNVDFIISYLNVPNDNSEYANSKQIKITDELFYLGVDVVLGSGSMAVQEKVDDEIELDGKTKHVYAIYSLGSLFGNYENDDSLLSVIANFNLNKEVIKDKDGNIISDSINLEIKNPVRIWSKLDGNYIIDDEIEKYNEGKSTFTSKEYEKMIEENNRITILFKE